MEAPKMRQGVPVMLRRMCERGRLEKQFLSDAYECLVPVFKCVDDDPRVSRGAASEYGKTDTNRVCCPGGSS